MDLSRGRGRRSRARSLAAARVLCIYILGTVTIFTASIVPFVLHRHVVAVSARGNDKVARPTKAAKRTDTTSTTSENGAQRSSNNDADIVHIVFSTDCSGYQHWQSIAMWYAAQSAGHQGPVTRIASGCSDEAQRNEILAEWDKIDGGRNLFRVHFTPKMHLERNYKYSNKPGGLRHWLAHANPKIEQEYYVVLLDPDMLPLLPITTRLGAGLDPTPRRRGDTNQLEYSEKSTGVARLLRVDDQELLEITDYVRRGRPAGQHFGLGGTWAFAGTNNARPKWKNFSKAHVCGEGSPCTTTSITDAKKKYAVGPVYLAHIADWYRIAEAWWEAMPRVHEQHPFLLAEMLALTMATANLTLPWSLVSNYMITGADVNSPTESWSWIDDIFVDNATAVCAGASSTTLPFVTRNRNALALPTTLHYCQRYIFADHLFAKRRMPHDFFRCDGDYLPFDIDAILRQLASAALKKAELRNAFMICHLIPMLNQFLDSYKRDACTMATT